MQSNQVQLTSKAQQLINHELRELFYNMVYDQDENDRRLYALEFIEMFSDVVATETVRQLQKMDKHGNK
jgi:hypothetical protein